ncbi:MAG: hypothetical protein AB8E82_01600 [Aureispira sp.]
MNCYFVFEGQTEPIVYKEWLRILVPDLEEVDFPNQVVNNHYIQFSDMGLPQLYQVVQDAITDINEAENQFDYLVVVMDADQLTVERRRAKLLEYLEEQVNVESNLYKRLPSFCQLVIIVQQVTIETWFLGNTSFVPNHPSSSLLREYKAYFDVCNHDPELMAADFVSVDKSTLFGYSTRAQFHAKYFNEVFKERTRAGYRKSKPKEVTQPSYLNQLLKRQNDTEHLASFKTFLDFCTKLNKQVEGTE